MKKQSAALLRFFRLRRGGGGGGRSVADSATADTRGVPTERLRLPKRTSLATASHTTSDNDDDDDSDRSDAGGSVVTTTGAAGDYDGNSTSDPPHTNDLPEYPMSDVVLGELLGQGTFATVHAVVCLPRQHGGAVFGSDYALKRVKGDVNNWRAAVTDLATEAWIYHQLPHKHLLTLHALVDDDDGRDNTNGAKALVVDRLHSTLREERQRWYKWMPRGAAATAMSLLQWRSLRPTTYQHVERLRLRVAVDLCSAVRHLHAHGIVHRDLKPSNVGFDAKGVVKLFDLGFARSLPTQKRDDPDITLYRLTARMGTWRYMAPEVARGDAYNAKCDVYSLALILWEMVVGQKPHKQLANHSDELRNLVTTGTERPTLQGVVPDDSHWPALMQHAWQADIGQRATIQQVHQALATQLEKTTKQSNHKR